MGREAEVDILHQAMARAAAGHGQIVAVSGEPGVGKSRLFWEFTHSHRAHGWLMMGAQATSYGRNTSYLTVKDLLQSYFQLEERDDPRRIREKVTGKLLTLDENLRPTLPAFLQLLDVPVDDAEWQTPDLPQRRQRMLDAVKRLILREGHVQPVLLVFENLHWLDSESQAFLDSLVDSLPLARALILVSYRPEYQHDWSRKSYYTQFRIDPLPPQSAEELLSALVGDDPGLDPLKQLLIERTEGNPFFLEESVHTLAETKVLAGTRGHYRLTREVHKVQVPATVQAVLAARIDRLPIEGKRLLQAAGVIGKDVPMALLQEIADMSEDAVRRILSQLQSAEFLYEISLFPSVEYTFRHALTHEVAYSSLLQDRRRALHGRVVQGMERLYADRLPEHYERLAHHAVRGEVWPKAVSYLRQAGAKAAMRSANREAVIFFEQAMNALTRLPEGRAATEQAIDLRLDLRSPLLQMGQLERVLTLSQEAEAMAEKLGDEQRLARVYTYLINYHYLKGEPDLAIEYGERCLRIGDAAGDASLQALARGYLGYSCHAQGLYRRAHAILRENVEALELVQGDAPGGQAGVSYVTSSGWLAFTLAELGEFDAAAMSLDRAQRAGEASGHAYTQTIARTMAGLAWLRRGQLERALPALQRSLDACREKSLDVWRPIPSSLLGLTLVLLGRVDEGLRLLEDGVSLTEDLGVRAYLALWTAHLGEGLAAARQADRARTVAQRALDLALRHKERGHQAWALRLLGEIAGQAEPPAIGEAEGYFGRALALAEELQMRPLQARSHLGLGRLLRLAGDRDRAEDHLANALGLLREMDMRFWLSRAAEELLHLGHLFVVARHNIQLYDYLKREYAGEPVTVILDRRHGQRRERDEAPASERRHAERRRQVQVDEAIRTRGFAVVPEIIGGA